MKNTNSTARANARLTIAFAVIALALCVAHLIHAMTSSQMFGVLTLDATASYLPLANKLIAAPFSLWEDSAAITVAPGGYAYMALVGAKPELIFILNIVLAVFSLLLVFDLCRRLGGLIAGLAGAILYSFSPLLIEVIVPVLNEPPYLFFTTLWLWATVLIRDKPDKKWPIIVSGLALLCSILTRAIYFYWLFPAIITCLLIYFVSQKTELKKLCLQILAAHLIAAAGAGAYTLHNWQTHGTAMIATGSGTALYFGSNPVTLGYEPPYLGMIHDEWMVTDRINSHLTPHNDRRLAWAAKQMLKDMPVADLTELYINKLGAILFFSQVNLEPTIFNDRAFRIFLLVLAAIGVFYNRKSLLVAMLFFIVLYVTAVHVPAMYNQRYSIGALDLPLTLLAALGLAHLARCYSNKKTISVSMIILLSGVFAGLMHQRYSAPLMPKINKGMSYLALKAPLASLEYKGFAGNPLASSATFEGKFASIIWKDISNHKRGGTPVISIDILEMDKNCKKIDLIYTDKNKQTWQSVFLLKKPKAPLTVTVGSLKLDNIDKYESQLELRFKCPINSKIKIDDISLYVSQAGLYYYDQIPESLK